MASYAAQARAAQKLEEAKQASAALVAMVSVHQQEFGEAMRPTAPPPPPVDAAGIRARILKEETAGIHWWRRAERKNAAQQANERAEAEIAFEQARVDREHAEAQGVLDSDWKRLLENDPELVMHTLEAAFADNEAPAVPVDCQGDRVTILMLMDNESSTPERVPTVTPTGKPSWRKLSQTDRSELYRAWISSNILATVREAFAVAPGLQRATIVVLRRDPETPYGEHSLSAVYVGTLNRSKCERIVWTSLSALDAILDADDLQMRTAGRTKALSPLDLTATPELAEFVSQVAAELQIGAEA